MGYSVQSITNLFVAVSRAATQSINNNTPTAVSFDTESLDLSAMYDAGNPTRITIPGSGNKLVTISAVIGFATGSTGMRRALLTKNGGAITGRPNYTTQAANASTTGDVLIHTTLDCAGGDYFELIATHTQGAALNITASLTAEVKLRA